MVRAAFTLQRRNKDIAEERVNRMSDNVGLPWRLRPPEIYSIICEDKVPDIRIFKAEILLEQNYYKRKIPASAYFISNSPQLTCNYINFMINMSWA